MTVTESVRLRVRAQAKERCGYCQVEERYVYAAMEIDHIIPRALGGSDEEENLWLACPLCNSFKGPQISGFDIETKQWIALFNPRQQQWEDHFAWGADKATIIGLTPCSRATIQALQINLPSSVALRRLFVRAGWYPPKI